MSSGRTDEWTYGSTDRQTDHLTYEWTFRPSHCGYKDYEIDASSTWPFAHPLTRLLATLTHSLPSSWEGVLCLRIECVDFIQF